MEYSKIETAFDRNEKFKVDTSLLRNPVFGIIKTWQVTEKIDGTNIRIIFSADGNLRIGGRTDNAQIPTKLLDALNPMFTAEKMKKVFWFEVNPTDIILYGEGYGNPIQKGGIYRPTPSFRLFDVLIGGKWWLSWESVCDIANKLGIKTVPYLGEMTLEEIISTVHRGLISECAKEDSGQESKAEGIVAKTVQPLFDNKGHRVIIKLKSKDFSA